MLAVEGAAGDSSTVTSARGLAERLALADMKLSAALTHGTPLEDLEGLRAASRLASDLAHRRLAIAGLKSGEGMSLEPSDKLVALLERLQADEGPKPAGEELTRDEGGHGAGHDQAEGEEARP
jgi:hypothetical protein